MFEHQTKSSSKSACSLLLVIFAETFATTTPILRVSLGDNGSLISFYFMIVFTIRNASVPCPTFLNGWAVTLTEGDPNGSFFFSFRSFSHTLFHSLDPAAFRPSPATFCSSSRSCPWLPLRWPCSSSHTLSKFVSNAILWRYPFSLQPKQNRVEGEGRKHSFSSWCKLTWILYLGFEYGWSLIVPLW